VRAAVAARLDSRAEIAVDVRGVPADAGPFRTARIDPNARLGKPMVVTLVPEAGRPVLATAYVRIVADYVVAVHAIERGHVVAADDVVAMREEVRDVPLRPLPVASEVRGARALRPIAAGSVVLPGFVLIRR